MDAEPEQSGSRGEPLVSKILNIRSILGEDSFGGVSLDRGQKLVYTLKSLFTKSK